jgi:glycerophosphoryl diester phosphodiesterase
MVALALLGIAGVFWLGRMSAPGADAPAGPRLPGSESRPTPAAQSADVAAFFDCVRGHGVVLGAHRGGPAPGLPENALETFVSTLRLTPLLEVDVQATRDGVLFLHHDRELDRTTTGTGVVADTDWAVIKALQLRDNDGAVTEFAPTTLDAALTWASASGAILQLDKKRTVGFADVVNAVRAREMLHRVVFITYSLEDAVLVHRLAPEAAMTVSIESQADVDRLRAEGVDLSRVLAWTGTRTPSPALWQALGQQGIESFFGTLGRPPESLDARYWSDGDPQEYQQLVAGGLQVIATDEVRRLAAVLSADDRALAACRLR